jgi:hypothetical protein
MLDEFIHFLIPIYFRPTHLFFSFLFVQRLLLLHVVGDITPGGHLSPILVDEIYAAMITNPMNNMSTVLAKCIR